MKQYDEALQAYRGAITLKQDSTSVTSAYVLMGRTDLQMGKKEEALQVYRTLQSVDSNAAQQLLDESHKTQ